MAIIVVRGKKVEEFEALKMVERAMEEGAAGVDMGRNVFQSEKPRTMLDALNHIVHERWTADQAMEFFQSSSEGSLTSTDARDE
ncbi:MAG: hypothetical protein ACYCYO_20255 [Bacilli bacterium]